MNDKQVIDPNSDFMLGVLSIFVQPDWDEIDKIQHDLEMLKHYLIQRGRKFKPFVEQLKKIYHDI